MSSIWWSTVYSHCCLFHFSSAGSCTVVNSFCWLMSLKKFNMLTENYCLFSLSSSSFDDPRYSVNNSSSYWSYHSLYRINFTAETHAISTLTFTPQVIWDRFRVFKHSPHLTRLGLKPQNVFVTGSGSQQLNPERFTRLLWDQLKLICGGLCRLQKIPL